VRLDYELQCDRSEWGTAGYALRRGGRPNAGVDVIPSSVAELNETERVSRQGVKTITDIWKSWFDFASKALGGFSANAKAL
jgi:hypothetical protein